MNNKTDFAAASFVAIAFYVSETSDINKIFDQLTFFDANTEPYAETFFWKCWASKWEKRETIW